MASRTPGDGRRERLERSRLYFVTHLRPGLEESVRRALEGGVDMVQLRDKEATDDELLRAARACRVLCDAARALLWVNDRPDLALETGADGVHVGQDDPPVGAVREQVGPELLVGLSTHAPEEFDAGLAAGADELSVGPVFETPTKAGRPATGLDYVRYAAERGGRAPWFAIGGIDGRTVGEVVAAGARRIVVARAIGDAADPRAAASELRAALDRDHVGAAR